MLLSQKNNTKLKSNIKLKNNTKFQKSVLSLRNNTKP